MAILRSLDGKFYEIPDDQANKFLIPADKVKDKLEACGAPAVPPGSPPSGDAGHGPGGATIVVQVFGSSQVGPPEAAHRLREAQAEAPAGEVQAYGWWNNWWHNRSGGWNNWWHNRY